MADDAPVVDSRENGMDVQQSNMEMMPDEIGCGIKPSYSEAEEGGVHIPSSTSDTVNCSGETAADQTEPAHQQDEFLPDVPSSFTETVQPTDNVPKTESTMTTMAVAAVQALPDLPDLPQAPQTGAVVTGPGGQREQKLFTPAKLTSAQQEAIAKAKKFAMEQSIKSVLLKQTLAHQQQLAQMQSVIQRPFTVMGSMQITDQVWTKLGTVYVGGISFDVREDTVKQAFQPFGPIKNVSLSWDAVANKHKGFAFVEYDLPEAASLSIEQMNNVMLGGRTIKMGRPSNMPQLQPIIERLAEEARPYNRVYVASIHPDLVENDVQSVFEAFGKIRSCKLAPDMLRPGKHRGYGFIEYETPQAANDAIASMNLFNLGGQYLRVGRAVSPPNAVQIPTFPAPMPTAAAVAAAAVTAKISALDAVPGTGLSPLALSSLMNAGIPMTGFAPPGIAIPHLAAPVVASAAAMSMPGVVIPQLAPPGVVTPMLTVQQFGGAGGMATAVSTAGGGLQAATAAAGKLSTSLQLTDAQKRLVEEDAGQTLASQENMQISGSQARQMVMQKLLRNTETRVMVLRNMVGPEDVDEDLESEVVDECSKYGNVNRVIIYQEKQSEADDAEILVKIFVEFHQPSEVEKATKALDNRYFAGRLIRAQPFDQAMFDANDLSG